MICENDQCRDIGNCEHDNGLIENKGPCTCGDTVCQPQHTADGDCNPDSGGNPNSPVAANIGDCSNNGLICNANQHECEHPVVCSTITETNDIYKGANNIKTCNCGNIKCTEAGSNNEYCDTSPTLHARNFLNKNIDLSIKDCDNWLIYWPQGAAACDLGKGNGDCNIYSDADEVDEKKVCEKSKLCFFTHATSGFEEDGDRYRCQFGECVVHPTCTNQDATVKNNNQCTCGLTTCPANKFCDYKNSQCLDVGQCANRNGVTKNTENCYCKNDVC